MKTNMNLGRKGFISGSSLFEEVIRYIGILVCPKKNQKIVKTCCLLRQASVLFRSASRRSMIASCLCGRNASLHQISIYLHFAFSIVAFYRCTTNVLEACLCSSDFNMFASALSPPAAKKQCTFLSISGLLLKAICLVACFVIS